MVVDHTVCNLDDHKAHYRLQLISYREIQEMRIWKSTGYWMQTGMQRYLTAVEWWDIRNTGMMVCIRKTKLQLECKRRLEQGGKLLILMGENPAYPHVHWTWGSLEVLRWRNNPCFSKASEGGDVMHCRRLPVGGPLTHLNRQQLRTEGR